MRRQESGAPIEVRYYLFWLVIFAAWAAILLGIGLGEGAGACRTHGAMPHAPCHVH